MSDGQEPSAASRARKDPLPWFRLHVAEMTTARGFMVVIGNSEAAAALLRFLLHSWVHGPVDDDDLVATCGAGATLLRDAMLRHTEDGWVLPALEDARTEQDSFRSTRAAAGRASASKRSTRVDIRRRKPNKVQPEEKRTEQKREEINPPLARDLAPSREGIPEVEVEVEADAEKGGTPLTRWWASEWARTRPTAFVWQRKDAIALAKCLQLASGDLRIAQDRVTRLLESSDPFHARSASPGLLLSHWNSFGFEVKSLNKVDAQVAEIMRQAAQPPQNLWSE